MLILEEPKLVQEVNEISKIEGQDTTAFLTDAVRRHIARYRQKRIQAETETWYKLPSGERNQYKGKFVAFFQNQVIDMDADRMALFRRVQSKWGRQPILIIEGGDDPMPEYQFRSPKRA